MKDFTGKIKAYKVLAEKKCSIEDPTKRRLWISLYVVRAVVRKLDPRAMMGTPTRMEDTHAEKKDVKICVFCKKEITGEVFVLPKCNQPVHKFCYEEEKLVWDFCITYGSHLFALIDIALTEQKNEEQDQNEKM